MNAFCLSRIKNVYINFNRERAQKQLRNKFYI